VTALTSFAAQLIEQQVLKEVRNATDISSGLHVWASGQRGQPGHSLVEWEDIGPNTISDVEKILKIRQPLTWHYLVRIATPEQRKRNAVAAAVKRRNRPPELVGHCDGTLV
jgi:hypothetical protein